MDLVRFFINKNNVEQKKKKKKKKEKKKQLRTPFPTWLAAPGQGRKRTMVTFNRHPLESAIYGKKWKTAPLSQAE